MLKHKSNVSQCCAYKMCLQAKTHTLTSAHTTVGTASLSGGWRSWQHSKRSGTCPPTAPALPSAKHAACSAHPRPPAAWPSPAPLGSSRSQTTDYDQTTLSNATLIINSVLNMGSTQSLWYLHVMMYSRLFPGHWTMKASIQWFHSSFYGRGRLIG